MGSRPDSWVLIPSSPLTSFVNLGMVCVFFVSVFLYLKQDSKSIHLKVCVRIKWVNCHKALGMRPGTE